MIVTMPIDFSCLGEQETTVSIEDGEVISISWNGIDITDKFSKSDLYLIAQDACDMESEAKNA